MAQRVVNWHKCAGARAQYDTKHTKVGRVLICLKPKFICMSRLAYKLTSSPVSLKDDERLVWQTKVIDPVLASGLMYG